MDGLAKAWLKIFPAWKSWRSRVISEGIALGFVLVLMYILSSSLFDAHWVIDPSAVIAAQYLGLLFGFLLVHTRWRGSTVLLYSSLLSAAGAIQAVGLVFPVWEVLKRYGFWENVGVMNLRLFTFFERVSNWGSITVSGGKILDQGVFVLIMYLVNWGLSTWMCWWVFRRWHGFEAIIPYAATFSLNVYFAHQPLLFMVYTLPIVILLPVYTSFCERWSDWEKRKIDYPYMESFVPEWISFTVFATLIITAAAWFLALTATPQGWKEISDSIEKLRHQNDPPVVLQQPPRAVNLAPAVILTKSLWAHSPQVKIVGEPPSQKMDTVFLVATDDQPPPPSYDGSRLPQKNRQRYWRSAIYVDYCGVGWNEAETENNPPNSKPDSGPNAYLPGRVIFNQQFYIVAEPDVPLFSANDPFQVSGANLVKTIPDGSILVTGRVRSYKVVSWVPNPSASDLTATGVNYPPQISNTYLQLPESLPKRVGDLASRLTMGMDTSYQKAVAIQDYLRSSYLYNLNVPPPEPKQDVVDYFLFYAQKGFCSYYASSMVVMLRSVGVPARLVTGYVNGDYDYKDHFYHVPLANAHAWVEVYFPKFGWVEFEPTPSQPAYDYAALDHKQYEPAISHAADIGASVGSSILPFLPWVAAGIILLGFLWVGWIMARLFFTGKRMPADRIIVLYRRTQRLVSDMGVVILPNSTPDEFWAQTSLQLKTHGHFVDFVQSITAIYKQLSYLPERPTDEAMRKVESTWGRALADWAHWRIVNGMRALWAKLARKR